MHLSSDAKDLLYKCSILTAMRGRLTSVLFGHTFRKLTFQVNKINHKNVVAGPRSGIVGHLTRKSGVLGSIPGQATYFRFSFRFFKKGSCQLLAKVCAGSTG